jgi:hypothetical protein
MKIKFIDDEKVISITGLKDLSKYKDKIVRILTTGADEYAASIKGDVENGNCIITISDIHSGYSPVIFNSYGIGYPRISIGIPGTCSINFVPVAYIEEFDTL